MAQGPETGAERNAQGATSMIAYDLSCCNGHVFEGWFEDAAAYASQKKKGLIACPVCGDTSVARLPSTFAIKAGSGAGQDGGSAHAGLEALAHQVHTFIEKNFDNVGAEFAKEALKIHYGVSSPRNIRGVSTKQEEETLRAEGVDFIKVPLPVSPKESG